MTAPARRPAPDHGGTPAPTPKRRWSTGTILGVAGGGLALVLVAVVVVVGAVWFGDDSVRFTAAGVGMEPAIGPGQVVTATEVDPGDYQPERGDIVVFAAPSGWLAGERDQMLIKRVIGLPGEHLRCCDPEGQWMIDGAPLAEPYVKAGGASASMALDVTVPAGRLWAMGDNRAASNDSRTLYASTSDTDVATIPVSAVVAVVKR